jgi:hypothetical protein
VIAVIRYIIELLPLQILIAEDVILFIGLRKVDTSLKLLRGKTMIITKVSMLSKIERSLDLDVTAEEMEAWKSGMYIQDAMPRLNEHEREFIMTGITQKEWDSMGELL